MGKGSVNLHASRAEFLPENVPNGDPAYGRKGGCFVTTKKAIALVVVAVVALIIAVFVLKYFYGSNRQSSASGDIAGDIEILLNNSLANGDDDDDDLHLPKNVLPVRYRLRIHPLLNESVANSFTFTGRVEILLRPVAATRRIVLNVDGLEMDAVTVSTADVVKLESGSQVAENSSESATTAVSSSDVTENAVTLEQEKFADGEATATIARTTTEKATTSATDYFYKYHRVVEVKIDNVEEKVDADRLVITLAESLEPSRNYTLDITYTGKISDKAVGLYRTRSADEGAWMASTNMLPSHARKVFPCFDEPEFKARFSLSVARKTSTSATSNMPVKESEPMPNNAGWVWDHFETTPPMSTYLLGFAVTDHAKLQGDGNGTVFQIWAPKNLLGRARYALDLGVALMSHMEGYLQIKYPLQKIDLVVVRETAEEVVGCWGIVFLRESSALLDPKTDTWSVRSGIFNLVARGISQQWFGNLATIGDWNDFWLNRAVNIFAAEMAANSLQPSWDYYNNFPLRMTHSVLHADSLRVTHSLRPNATDLLLTGQLFDEVIYKKGGCLLRMLNHTITEPVFRRGLEKYLREWSYNSSAIYDLWDAFGGEESGNATDAGLDFSVREFMNSWVFQDGYPVVSLDRNYKTGEVVVGQRRFTENATSSTSLWYIPVSYRTNLTSEGVLWMRYNESMSSDALAATPNDAWILLNVDQTGFYRVNYDRRNWHLLKAQLETDHERLSPPERAQILDDALGLAEMNQLDYPTALSMTGYLAKKERNYVPFAAVLENLAAVEAILARSEHYGLYQEYVKGLVGDAYQELGSVPKDGEPLGRALLRIAVAKAACDVDHEPCLRWAKELFDQWMRKRGDNPIPHDLKETAMCAAIKQGGKTEWEFLWNMTLSRNATQADLLAIYPSLGCAKDEWLLRRYLHKSVSGEISAQDVPLVWKSLARQPQGVFPGLAFLREKWHLVEKSHEDVAAAFRFVVRDFISQLSTRIDLENLTMFYKSNQKSLRPLSAEIKEAVDRIKLRIAWREKHLPTVVSWLKKNIPS